MVRKIPAMVGGMMGGFPDLSGGLIEEVHEVSKRIVPRSVDPHPAKEKKEIWQGLIEMGAESRKSKNSRSAEGDYANPPPQKVSRELSPSAVRCRSLEECVEDDPAPSGVAAVPRDNRL